MLSGPHQKFAEGIATGLNNSQAYRAAYPKASAETARPNGAKLLTNTLIRSEIERLRAAVALMPGGAVITLAERRGGLAAIFRSNGTYLGSKVSTQDRIRAAELDAKLAGELTEKVQVEAVVGVITVTIGT